MLAPISPTDYHDHDDDDVHGNVDDNDDYDGGGDNDEDIGDVNHNRSGDQPYVSWK